MKIFGEAKWGPACAAKVPPPVGQKCTYCQESVADGDSGVLLPVMISRRQAKDQPLHKECFLRGIFGSVGHQMGKCHCRGGSVEDPEGMTKRQAAIAAVEYMNQVGPFQPPGEA